MIRYQDNRVVVEHNLHTYNRTIISGAKGQGIGYLLQFRICKEHNHIKL